MSIEYTLEDPPTSFRFRPKSPLAAAEEAIEANTGRWLKFPGRRSSAQWAKKRGYETTVRGKDLYVRKPAKVQLPGLLPQPPKRGRSGMRVVGMPSLVDSMDEARIGRR